MKSKAELRKEIEAQTAKFLQSGGLITKVNMQKKRGELKKSQEMSKQDIDNLPLYLRLKLQEYNK